MAFPRALKSVYTLLILLSLLTNTNCQCQDGNVNTETGRGLNGATFHSFTAVDYRRCLTECVRSTGCRSLNFLMTNGMCELNSETKMARPDLYEGRENCIYTTKMAYHEAEMMEARLSTTESPTTGLPTTQATTHLSTGQTATTQLPTTQQTTTGMPTTQPTTQSPTTKASTLLPTTQPTTTELPTTEPTTHSTTGQPATTESPTTQPTTTELSTTEPTTQPPTTKASTLLPTTQPTTTGMPTTQQTTPSSTGQPATTQSPTTQPTTTGMPTTQQTTPLSTGQPATTQSPTTQQTTTGMPTTQPTTLSPTTQSPTTQAAQASYPRSCLEILRSGVSTGDGVYSIDPSNTGTPIQAYCDMTTDGGGWTIVKRTILQTSTPPLNQRFQTYEVISEFNTNNLNVYPTTKALLDIKNTMGFHQIHFYCHKQSVGRVISIRTKNDTAGHQVARYYTDDDFALTNFVAACGSFDRLPEDTSVLGQNCAKWNKDTGTWGKDSGSSRTLANTFFIKDANTYGCSVSPPKVEYCACDDDQNAPLAYNPQDRWQISVR